MPKEAPLIVRVVKDKNNPYVQINKTCLNDNRLSWKSKGLLCYMLSMPDDWVFHREEIIRHSNDGMDSLKSALKELKKFGYVTIEPIKENGLIKKWYTRVFETPELAKSYRQEAGQQVDFPQVDFPQVDFPQVDFPQVDFPQVEKPPTTNNDLLTNNNNNKKPPENEIYRESVSPEPETLTESQEVVVVCSFQKELEDLGATAQQITQWLRAHGPNRLKEAYAMAVRKAKVNKIGFLSAALAKGWLDIPQNKPQQSVNSSIEETKLLLDHLRDNEARKAPPEANAPYLAQIRNVLGRRVSPVRQLAC